MREIFQQYSYVWISLGVVLVSIAVMRILHLRWRVTLLAAGGLAVVLGASLLILRPGQSDVNSFQAAEAMLTNGKPTFLEFFSNY
jgi:hypothetical protein